MDYEKSSLCNEIVKNSKLAIGLSPSEVDTICKHTDIWIQNYPKGTRIWSQDDYVPYIDILVSGTLISQKYHIDGKIQLICSFAPPEIVNIEAVTSRKKTSPVFIAASTECSLLRINYSKLINSKEIPSHVKLILLENIAAYLANDSIKFMYKSEILSRRKVKERIVTFLNLLRHLSGSDTVDTGMSQDELAQYLCVDRTSLSEALNDLRRNDLVDFKKSKFTIKFQNTDSF